MIYIKKVTIIYWQNAKTEKSIIKIREDIKKLYYSTNGPKFVPPGKRITAIAKAKTEIIIPYIKIL